MVFPLNTSVNIILLNTKFDEEPQSSMKNRNRRSHRRDEEHARLGIPESLPELVPLPMMVPADGLVLPDALHGDLAFARGEPAGIALVIRYEEGEEEGEGKGEGAEEDVEELPCWERGVDWGVSTGTGTGTGKGMESVGVIFHQGEEGPRRRTILDIVGRMRHAACG
jgi:hypothetical protein